MKVAMLTQLPRTNYQRGAVIVILAGLALAWLSFAHAFSQDATVQPSADTYVASGHPTQSQPADLRVVWVGYNSVDSYGKERALLQFNLADLSATSTIASARLSLYLARANPATDTPMTIGVSRLAGAWDESITWNQHEELTRLGEAATLSVDAQTGWYHWEIRELVQGWLADPARGPTLSLLLTGDEAGTQRERAFWSKDCKPSDCDPQPGKRPQLAIQVVAPTPTPTASATVRPTATPPLTPTPTLLPIPGIQWVRLNNEPHTSLRSGDEVTYTITYQNGPYALTDVQIVSLLPTLLTWSPDSLRTSSGALVSMQQTTAGTQVRWSFPLQLPPYQRGELVYRLRRAVATPPSSGLTIHKQGPVQAKVNELIRYDLAVANHTTTTLMNLLITDTIPIHAFYIAGGTRSGDQVYWHVATLSPGATVTNTFVVTAAQTITNSVYGVRAGGGLAATGTTPVVTLIQRAGEPPITLSDTIVHTGGYMTWRYQDTSAQLPINPVYNPSFDLFLPVVRQRRTE